MEKVQEAARARNEVGFQMATMKTSPWWELNENTNIRFRDVRGRMPKGKSGRLCRFSPGGSGRAVGGVEISPKRIGRGAAAVTQGYGVCCDGPAQSVKLQCRR